MIMNEQTLQKLKDIEKDMLVIFIQICKKYDMRYFLAGGSCLGAVRHRGFIPWDDDIDVVMPREDYEKFLKVARNELPENIFLQTGKTDNDFPMNFAKLRNSDTTFIETSVKNFKINHGVFIDIFPLDGYSDSKWFKLMNRIYISRINLEYVLPFTAKKTLFRKMRHWILRTVFPDYRRARDLREKLIRKRQYNESKFVINYCGAWGEREVMSRDTFGSGCKATFEGIEVVIPEKYDEFLTRLYGDYMELPPIEKRIGHHYYEVIDLDKSYCEHSKARDCCLS